MSQESKKLTPPIPSQNLDGPPGVEEKMSPRPESDTPIQKEKLKGKKALITGGDSGIGRAVALLFAKHGADVAFTHLEAENVDAEETKSRIQREDQAALPIQVDLQKADSVETIIGRCTDEWGDIDILINNAAFQNHVSDIDDLNADQWRKTFEINVFSMFALTKSALKHMKEGSCIINTASITGVEGSGALLDYSATKGAIISFTKSLANQLAKRKIRVNCVSPGPVWTPLNPAERSSEEMKCFGHDTLWGRPAQPNEIAPSYLFLACEGDSGYITGENIRIFGDTTGG